jgi:hypothetical protein
MKRMIAVILLVGLVSTGLVSICLVGCIERTSSTKREFKITTPGGTTTITTKGDFKGTGDNPPAATP